MGGRALGTYNWESLSNLECRKDLVEKRYLNCCLEDEEE